MNLSLSAIDLPVRLRFERPLTDEELMRFCGENETVRVEREKNGEILITTPAGFKTSRMNQRIGRLLDEWAESDGRGVSTDSNGGYTLPDSSMRAPDAAWVASDRLKALSDQDQSGFAPICPDFIIELRSPTDRLPDLQARMRQWIDNGAQVAWLIDPQRRVVEVYRPNEDLDIHEDPSSVQGDGPIRGFELVLSRIWN